MIFRKKIGTSKKRRFIESCLTEGINSNDREKEIMVITRTIIKLRELWINCGRDVVWYVLTNGASPMPPKEIT